MTPRAGVLALVLSALMALAGTWVLLERVNPWSGALERAQAEAEQGREAVARAKARQGDLERAVRACRTLPAQKALASWYGPGFHGEKVAGWGRKDIQVRRWHFDQRARTVASRTIPLGAMVLLERGKRQALAQVTDYGPHKKTGRDMDVSEVLAEELGFKNRGEATIIVRRLL